MSNIYMVMSSFLRCKNFGMHRFFCLCIFVKSTLFYTTFYVVLLTKQLSHHLSEHIEIEVLVVIEGFTLFV